MGAGDVINGYRLLGDFTTAGGGLSMWTMAERGGRTYFLKQFLAPKYPDLYAPGTERTKAARRRECERFEQHHRRIAELLQSRSVPGGNLVVTIDFFRVDGIYYKITEAIEVSSVSVNDIAALAINDRLLILKTVTHSVGILHGADLVHGDIKPDNVLIKQTAAGNYTAKLIDFDNCFVANDPPDPDETVGDLVFLSPELAAHMVGERVVVSTASDIFALGVLFTLYLTGRVPPIEGAACTGAQVYERVMSGGTPRMEACGIPNDLAALIGRMLQSDPRHRPTAPACLQALQRRSGVKGLPTMPTETRLRGRLLDELGDWERASGLRGSLLRPGGER